MYFYQIFGLNVASEIKFNIRESEGLYCDVFIYNGNVDFKQKDSSELFEGIHYIKAEKKAKLHVEEVAFFEIKEGREIVVDHLKESSMPELFTFLFGTCMSLLLSQRNVYSFHGSGIVNKHGGVCVFLGHSGMGKSTTLAYFLDDSYNYISDDVIPLVGNSKDGCILAQSSIPGIKLWENNLQNFSLGSQGLMRIRKGVNKFRLNAREGFRFGTFRLDGIFILNWSDREYSLSQMDPCTAIPYLRENIYRIEMWTERIERERLFTLISNIAAGTKIYLIEGERSFQSLANIKNFINIP